ncbi:hypothetical protein ACE38W_19350 [Chitinophaga sp. Hz27]|uniref:hypothetical protein n=1 Tax=Chitinophaga sp. Hz27 TaxID=3347169 RepID=UPI0035DB7383
MKKIIWLLLFQLVLSQAFSQPAIYLVANCQGEKRAILFNEQLTNVLYTSFGNSFKKNGVIKYAANNKIDKDSLDAAAARLKDALPKDFMEYNIPATALNSHPDEQGKIWFQYVITETVKNKTRLIGTIKVIFAGTNAATVSTDPRIEDITISSDPQDLKKYMTTLKQLKKANHVKAPLASQKDATAVASARS